MLESWGGGCGIWGFDKFVFVFVFWNFYIFFFLFGKSPENEFPISHFDLMLIFATHALI